MASQHLFAPPLQVVNDYYPSKSLIHLTPFSPSPPPTTTLSSRLLSRHSSLSSSTSISDPLTHQTRPDPDPKPNVWVNPNSPRASHLLKQSHDSKYSSLVSIAQNLDSCDSTIHDVGQVLFEFFDTYGNENDALIVLNNMRNPDNALLVLRCLQERMSLSREVVLYNVTLKVFRKKKDLVGAQKVFDEMLQRGVKPDNVTFSTIISCARSCNEPEKAVELFEKMPEFGCDPDDVTYSAMIDVYGRAGEVDRALALYDRARTENWRIDVVTFATLIKIYRKTGNFDGCLNVYEEMKALKVKPNLVIYNSLLDAMGRAKRPWQVRTIYKQMIGNGFAPSWMTYAALLKAFCRTRHAEDAMKVYKEMREKGMTLNVILYNSLLAMCADLGHTDDAVQIYADMKSSGTCFPDDWTFSSVITVYSCSGLVTEAEGVLNEMMEAGFQPTIHILTSLLQCYGKANRTDDVMRTLDRVLELGIAPDDRLCGCLLNIIAQASKEELPKLLGCVEKANQKLSNVVKLLFERESSEEQLRGAATELFDSISNDVKRSYCNCLIDLCVNLNFLDRACVLLDLGLTLRIYAGLQFRTPARWSLHLKSLSVGAALTSLRVWMNDLSKAIENGEELPPVIGINTGLGQHKYSEKGLAGGFQAHLKELNAPFHEAPGKGGWFLTTRTAAKSWLESLTSPELASE